jgi:hypothetical protein
MNVDTSSPLSPFLEPYTGTAGIAHVWYETVVNTVIDADFATTAPSFFNAFDFSVGQIEMSIYETFFVAFWLDATSSGIPDANDVYGWAELMWNGTDLLLLDSAAENSGVGIIAGQYQVVPEPATILLFCVGIICVCVQGNLYVSEH